jgi:hypothetical protein
MELIEIIQNDKPNKNYTAAHKKAQYKYNALHAEQVAENKIKWYRKNKDTEEFKERTRKHNRNAYQKRKERLNKEKLLIQEPLDVLTE